jgi:hypothetical protein
MGTKISLSPKSIKQIGVHENKVLIGIFWHKREDKWQEELEKYIINLKSRRVSQEGNKEWVQNFCRKSWEKCPLERSRRRCEDNIKTYFKELGCGDMDLIEFVTLPFKSFFLLSSDDYLFQCLVQECSININWNLPSWTNLDPILYVHISFCVL